MLPGALARLRLNTTTRVALVLSVAARQSVSNVLLTLELVLKALLAESRDDFGNGWHQQLWLLVDEGCSQAVWV